MAISLKNHTGDSLSSSLPPEGGYEFERVAVPELAMNDVRQFYDPTDQHAELPADQFVDWAASTRKARTVAGVGAVTAHEALLAEVTHALPLAQEQDEVLLLPVAEARQRDVRSKVYEHAGRIAVSLLDTTDEIFGDWDKRIKAVPEAQWQPLPSRLLVSGKVLAAVAHEKQFRRSGRDYFMHPDEVSSIIGIAWRKQGFPEGPDLDLIRFLAYAHDGFEDTIDPHGKYLERPLFVSPLVAHELLCTQGVDKAEAEAAALTLLNMTRVRDVDDNRMEYLDYIKRGANERRNIMSRRQFQLTKPPDVQHNLNIEPDKIQPGDTKTVEKYLKRAMYKNAAYLLRRASEDEAYAYVVDSVFETTKAEVLRAQEQKYPLNLARIIASVRQNLRRHEKKDISSN